MKLQASLVVLALVATPLDAAEQAKLPSFFALSVPSLDASVKWYSENLGLTATLLPPTPQARVALLRSQGLLVELVEHSESFPLASRLPGLKGRYLVQGVFKVGFFVRDLDATITRLEQRGVRFKGSVYKDERAKVRSVLVLDNNENVIQLFEPLP